MRILGWVGAWVIRRLVGMGVSEARAGKLVASSAFGPVMCAFAVAAGGAALWLMHTRAVDAAAMRVETVCLEKHRISALRAERDAKAEALRKREARDLERAKELAAAHAAAERLGVENAKLRKAVAGAGDRAVFAADDCWLLRTCGAPAGNAEGRP